MSVIAKAAYNDTFDEIVVCCERMKTAIEQEVFVTSKDKFDEGFLNVRPHFNYAFQPQYDGEYNFERCPWCDRNLVRNKIQVVH